MDYSTLTPPKVLIGRYALEAQLMAPGSLAGHQQEQAELGLGGKPQEGARVNVAAVLRARLGDLLLFCQDLNDIEQEICWLRYATVARVLQYSAFLNICELELGASLYPNVIFYSDQSRCRPTYKERCSTVPHRSR